MSFAGTRYSRVIEYIYENTKPGSTYDFNQVIRGPVSRYGSSEAAKTATLAAARQACPDGDISPGIFKWYRFRRVCKVAIRSRGTREDLLRLARVAYQLWYGEEAPE